MIVTIQTARACIGFQGDEKWAIQTICQQSGLDIHPAEVQILSVHGSNSPYRERYVYGAGKILGSYTPEFGRN